MVQIIHCWFPSPTNSPKKLVIVGVNLRNMQPWQSPHRRRHKSGRACRAASLNCAENTEHREQHGLRRRGHRNLKGFR
jgi:hypothetical protein